MGRAVVRRHAALTATVALLAAGCVQQRAGDHYANHVDVDRAAAAWTDPWLAPTDAAPAGAVWGSAGEVDRSVAGRRTTWATGTPSQVAAAEIGLARAHGWSLAGASCAEAVEGVLVRGSGDDVVVARVEATDAGGRVDVEVQAFVPHHADDDWPSFPRVESSCLDDPTASFPEAPRVPAGPPTGAVADRQRPDWHRDQPTAAEKALRTRIAGQQWLREAGARLPEQRLSTDHARRSGGGAQGVLPDSGETGSAALAQAVDRLEAEGWVVTWTSCGGGAPAQATLKLEDEAGPAVVRLDASAEGPVGFVLRLPVVEGPDPQWLDRAVPLTSRTCLDDEPVTQLTAQGVPAVLPDALQPWHG